MDRASRSLNFGVRPSGTLGELRAGRCHGQRSLARAAAEVLLDAAERRLLQFRQANQIPQRTSAQEARAGEQAALMERVIESESNLTTAKAQIKALQAQMEEQPRTLIQDNVKENLRVASLQGKLDDLNTQREDLLDQYTASSRPVRELDRRILRLQRQLAAEPKALHVQTRSPSTGRRSRSARRVAAGRFVSARIPTERFDVFAVIT